MKARVFAVAPLVAVGLACGGPGVSGSVAPDAEVESDAAWTIPDTGLFIPASVDGGAVTPREPDDKTCAEQIHTAALVPVDLLLSIDASGSMNGRLAPGSAATKWTALRDALKAFVADPGSVGLGVGLQYFPTFEPCADVSHCPAGSTGCVATRACSGTGTATDPLVPCTANAHCTLPGSVCTGLGSCGTTGRPCLVGQTCTGADGAGDVCAQRAGLCDFRLTMAGANPIWCNPARYREPTVAISDLPGHGPALVRLMDSLLPTGVTPMSAAVVGALEHLRARSGGPAARRQVLVLSSDGAPTACPPLALEAIADVLAAESNRAPAITTFVIGVYTPAEQAQLEPALRKLAAGGASGTPFIVNPNQDLAAGFLAALARIRESVLPCEYEIPRMNASIDYGRVNLAYAGAGGEVVVVGNVRDAASCHPTLGGWYYDVGPAPGLEPTVVRTCELTCRQLRAASRVQLRFGCKTRYIE